MLFPLGIWQFVDFAFTNLSNSSNIDDFPKEKWSSVWLTLPVCLVICSMDSNFIIFCLKLFKNALNREESLKGWSHCDCRYCPFSKTRSSSTVART